MAISVLISQMLLTIPLTLILNFLKREKIGNVAEILIPSIYMIMIAAFFPSLKPNIFLIVIFEIFIHNFYITNIVNETKEEKIEFLTINILSALISILTYNYFINNVTDILPSAEEIKPFLWFIIIMYLCTIIEKILSKYEAIRKEKSIKHNKEQIIMQYAKYKNKYASFVKSKTKLINDLTYSIMVHETLKKPPFYHKIEEYVGAITKRETAYGIMRIKSYTHLTDEESIKVVVDRLEKKTKQQKEKIDIVKLLNEYSEEDIKSIMDIYQIIEEFTNK